MSAIIKDEIAKSAAELEEAGVDTPRLDAELLICRVTGLTRTQLITKSSKALNESQHQAFREMVEKRRRRWPLPYLLGVWEFWGMEFEVNPSVLIPRPETEILVESCAERLKNRSVLIGEIGAGSGAIAISIAKEMPEALVYATEISLEAADVAARNAARNGVADRVKILTGDLTKPLFAEDLAGRLDALVSNPPYIADDAAKDIQPEVLHEPAIATFAGPDRLTFYRRILADAPRLLVHGGEVFFEVDPGISQAIAEIAASMDLRLVETRRDLAGLERVVVLKCES